MTGSSNVSVSISGKLLRRLRVRAAELEVPVNWLVVGLVCDGLEHMAHGCLTRPDAPSTDSIETWIPQTRSRLPVRITGIRVAQTPRR
jgi:hypothetical protein